METIAINSKLDLKTYFLISLSIAFKLRTLIFIAAIIIVCSIFIYYNDGWDWIGEAWLVGYMALYLGVVIPIIVWFSCKRNMKISPVLVEGATYYINDEFIEGKTDSSSSKTTWKYIKKVIEKDKYFILSNPPRVFYYLPKDGFNSPQDINLFKNMVKANNIVAYFKPTA